MGRDQGASADADRAATPSGPSPEEVSGIAGIPCAKRVSRKFPTGLPLVDRLRSCMLQNVPRGQSGTCSSLPYDAAEQVHDLYDALAEYMECVAVASDPAMRQADVITLAELSERMTTARDAASAALAKARGQ